MFVYMHVYKGTQTPELPNSSRCFIQPWGQAFKPSFLRPLWKSGTVKLIGFLKTVNSYPRAGEGQETQSATGNFWKPHLPRPTGDKAAD